mgnify:CR=1 FL=1
MLHDLIPTRPRWQVGDVFFDALARHQEVVELRYEDGWVYVTKTLLVDMFFRFTDADFMSEFDFTPPALTSSSGQ